MPLRGVRRLALLTVLVAAAGCTSSTSKVAGHTTPTSSPSQSPSSPPASPAPVHATEITVVPAQFEGDFVTPSGNIRCAIGSGTAWCGVTHRAWHDAPMSSTEDCRDKPQLWRTTVWLYGDRGSELRGDCYDAFDSEPEPAPLPYGHALQVGRIRCVSESAGVDCVVVGTAKGFFVSRETYRLTARRTPLTTQPTLSPVAGPLVSVPYGFAGGFRTSDWGIVCDITDSDAHCLFNAPTSWDPPPRTQPCHYDRSTEVEVGAAGPGHAFTGCRSDSLGGTVALVMGHGIRVGSIECWMRTTGIDCRNGTTRHGFVVSDKRFRGF